MRYKREKLPKDVDNGTMPAVRANLEETVVGQRIVSARMLPSDEDPRDLELTLENGTRVFLESTQDCCAYTEIYSFALNAASIDHIITGVGTTESYTRWHIFADFGDILTMNIGWSPGNPFYYGYGFNIRVKHR